MLIHQDSQVCRLDPGRNPRLPRGSKTEPLSPSQIQPLLKSKSAGPHIQPEVKGARQGFPPDNPGVNCRLRLLQGKLLPEIRSAGTSIASKTRDNKFREITVTTKTVRSNPCNFQAIPAACRQHFRVGGLGIVAVGILIF